MNGMFRYFDLKLLALLYLFWHCFDASAGTFEVTTAEEFQAALITAGDSGAENKIVLEGELFTGNFRFTAESAGSLEIIRGSNKTPTLGAENKAYGLFIDLRKANYSVRISGVRITKGRSRLDGGGLLILADNSGASEVVLDDIVIRESSAEFFGGGLAAHGLARIEILNSRFEQNFAKRGGGGISLEAARALFRNVVVGGNEVRPENFSGFNGDLSYCYPFAGSGAQSPELIKSNGLNGNPSSIVGGAGAILWNGDYVFELSEVSGNRIECDGGGSAAIMAQGRLQISGSEIKRNSAVFVPIGASLDVPYTRSFPIIEATGEEAVLANTTVSQNSVSYRGCNFPVRRSISLGDSAKVEGLTMRGNLVSGGAGCLDSDDGRGSLLWLGENSTLRNSLAVENSGAAVGVKDGSAIFGNVIASQSDMAVRVDGSVTMTNNTILGNPQAVGIHPKEGDDVILKNNIFQSFTPGQDPSLYIDDFAELFGSGFFSDARNNLWLNVSTVFDQDFDNSSQDPKFYDVEANDFHLASDSPAINAGDSLAVSNIGSDFDLDGSPRVIDGTIDIGAYERYTLELHPADTNGDSSISEAEFVAYNAAWRANEIWPVAPTTISADFVTRAGYLYKKGGAYRNIGVGKPITWVPVVDE